MSDLTDWLTAVGTVGAVITSLFFSARDGRRAAAKERRHQAEQITAWIEPKQGGEDPNHSLSVIVLNASSQPAYHFVASLIAVQGAFRQTAVGDTRSDAHEYRTLVGLVAPGRHEVSLPWKGYAAGLRFGVELAFQDSAGRYWLRGGLGGLKEVRSDPVKLYHIQEPIPWGRT